MYIHWQSGHPIYHLPCCMEFMPKFVHSQIWPLFWLRPILCKLLCFCHKTCICYWPLRKIIPYLLICTFSLLLFLFLLLIYPIPLACIFNVIFYWYFLKPFFYWYLCVVHASCMEEINEDLKLLWIGTYFVSLFHILWLAYCMIDPKNACKVDVNVNSYFNTRDGRKVYNRGRIISLIVDLE